MELVKATPGTGACVASSLVSTPGVRDPDGGWGGRESPYSQSLGVAGNIPGHAAQRQPVTVHCAARAGALRRARLRRHLVQDRQH